LSTRLVSLLPLVPFLNAPPPPHVYTLSLHDALPIFGAASFDSGASAVLAVSDVSDGSAAARGLRGDAARRRAGFFAGGAASSAADRKSTRLNSSHVKISYAVFCLKKKT